ncbi:MAG TPA: hypothetical protein VKR06_46275 [Ktedonosporobacter sp.]|nr:hypothetical protein [Ktedonosporobacter sp.]
MTNEDPSSGAGATPNPDQPVMGTPAPAGATPTTKPATTTLEEALARIAELEHSHKNAVEERDRHRKKLSGYEEAEKKAQEAQLSEVERIKKQHADLQSQHDALVRETQELRVHQSVERHAARLKFIRPEIAAKLLDWSEIEYEENGSPKNIDKLLEKLVKSMPELAHASSQQAPSTPNQPTTPAIPAMNPGRTAIQQPSAQPGRPPRLSDPGVFVPPGTPSRYQP